MDKIRTIILQPTSLCNLNCSYCYIPEESRKNKEKMEFSILEKIVKAIFSSHEIDKNLKLVWHSGEPLTAGIPFYEKATEIINHYKPPNINIIQGVQTNAVLINDAWCQFIKENNFSIGVSIDGPKEIHDKNRLNWSNKGSFGLTMRGIGFLKKHDISFTALMVITRDSLDFPDQIVDFFLENEISDIGFNIEELTGSNASSSLTNKENTEERYKKFIDRFIDLWMQHSTKIRVREFEKLTAYIMKKLNNPKFVAPQIESAERGILTINQNGNIIPFSPDLAFGTIDDKELFVVDNIKKISNLSPIFETPKFKEMSHAIQEGVRKCKKECEYFDLCGGGHPTNKFFEWGTFSVSETKFCRYFFQFIIDSLLEKFSKENKFVFSESSLREVYHVD